MRQSDIFSIIIIATVGTLAAYFAVNSLLGDPNLQSVQFKTIEGISSDLEDPDSELFNSGAINPTVEVYVGDCEDVDQNGILSKEELIACGKITEGDVDKTEFYYCPDGTAVLDMTLCPDNRSDDSGNGSDDSGQDDGGGDDSDSGDDDSDSGDE